MEFEIESLNNLHRRLFKLMSLVFSACLIALIVMSIKASAQSPSGSSDVGPNKNYKIGVGDVLKVSVSQQPLLSLDGVRVSNEGAIRLPMLDDDITAVCLTEDELAGTIVERYKKYVLNPQVYVAVQQFNSNPVALIGAVIAPGSFVLERPTRLLQLLTVVRGPAANAGKNIQIIRQPSVLQCAEDRIVNTNSADPVKSENEERFSVLLAETLKGNESANPFLKAGDIISIAAADEPEVAYIIGNVVRPTPIQLTEPTTLSKAIAIAGGTIKDAKIEKIKISRQDPQTLAKTEILVNLKEINGDRQKDILLQANDIIEVPGTKPSLLGTIFKSIIPVVTRGIVPLPY
jgi:polysaccharide export outer membrane protein